MRNLLVKQLADGTYALTEFGTAIQVLAIKGVGEMRNLLKDVIPILRDFVSFAKTGFELFKIYMIPVQIMVRALQMLGPTMTKVLLGFHLLSKIIPIATIAKYAYVTATIAEKFATTASLKAKMAEASTTPMFVSAAMGLIVVRKLSRKETWLAIGAKIYEMTIDRAIVAYKIIMHILYKPNHFSLIQLPFSCQHQCQLILKYKVKVPF